jgi:acetylornithine/N-succinyldiaminopimelate aminotransferase
MKSRPGSAARAACLAYEHAGITPDIMTLAKGLGGGVPLAALVAHRDVCCFEYGDQGGTFCGNPLMAAVGCAVIEEVTKPGFLARVEQAGDYLAGRLRELSRGNTVVARCAAKACCSHSA